MPMANDLGNLWGKPTRTLIYGKDKTKKTWWACRAAEAGFNVILLDGDDGSSIVRNLPVEAKKRILVADVVDNQKKAVYAQFMTGFLKPGNVFIWDEMDKCTVPVTKAPNPDHSYIKFDPSKFTMNDVVIVDSWTALADSTKQQFAAEANYDLIAVEKDGDNFGLPNFQARILDWMLSKLHTLPCHIIVVGHEQVWDQYKGKGKERRIVGTFTQAYSSTGPHSQKLGKHFENVFHFYRISDTAYRIGAIGDDHFAGGSRLIPPGRYEWDKYTPADLFKAVGSVATGSPCEGAIYVPKGRPFNDGPVKEIQQIPQETIDASAKPAVLDGSKVTEVKGLSLSEKLKAKQNANKGT